MFVAGAAVLPESSPRELVARDVHKAGGRDALGGGEGETIKRWALKEDRPPGDRRGIETNDLGMPEMAAYPKTEAENSVISVIGSENSTKTDTKQQQISPTGMAPSTTKIRRGTRAGWRSRIFGWALRGREELPPGGKQWPTGSAGSLAGGT